MIQTYEELQDFFSSRRQLGIQLGLERLYYLLDKLHHPEKELPVVHIAGTNGKGSTLTFIRQVLIDSGYRVGSFVSPGLPTILDHIYFNDERIALDEFLQLLNEMMPVIHEMDQKEINPTEYEILMVITLLYFKNRVDIALIETAMGGLEDITNCVQPIITMITNVSNDHIGFLGPTLANIAEHKAGIIKDQIPVVLGEMDEEVLPILEQAANEMNAPIYQYGKDFHVECIRDEIDKQVFLWETANQQVEVAITMLGKHQIHNASCAMMACHLLVKQGYSIDENRIREGFRQATIAYRMEKINENPVIYVDGAHNEAGIRAFSDTVAHYYSPEEVVIIVGVFKDKDVSRMIRILNEKYHTIYAMEFEHPRAMKKIDYEKLMDQPRLIENPSALKRFINNEYKHLFFVGSLHFVSYIKQLIRNI